MPRAKPERTFVSGDEVRIAKKSRVVDKKREHENLPKAARIPIDQDVTGTVGRVIGTPYASPSKDGEICVPIERRDGAVMAVPSTRLEKVDRNPRLSAPDSDGGGHGGVSPATIQFWEEHFRNKAKLEKLKKRKKG